MSQKYIAVKDFPQYIVTRDDIVHITRQERTPNGLIHFDGDTKGELPANIFHLVFERIEPTPDSLINRTKVERISDKPTFKPPDAYDISPQVNMSIDEYVNRGKSTTIYGPAGYRVQLLQYEEQHFRAFVEGQINKALREHGIDPQAGASV